MHPKHFRKFIVRPALEVLGLRSESSEELLMLTWATESLGGSLVKQGSVSLYDGNGVALGVFQHEPVTYRDDWDNFLRFKPDMKAAVMSLSRFKSFIVPPETDLIGNLPFAAAMCRVHYYRFNEPLLPRESFSMDYNGEDAWLEHLAYYYKKHWNTSAGKATVSKALLDYKEIVHGRK